MAEVKQYTKDKLVEPLAGNSYKNSGGNYDARPSWTVRAETRLLMFVGLCRNPEKLAQLGEYHSRIGKKEKNHYQFGKTVNSHFRLAHKCYVQAIQLNGKVGEGKKLGAEREGDVHYNHGLVLSRSKNENNLIFFEYNMDAKKEKDGKTDPFFEYKAAVEKYEEAGKNEENAKMLEMIEYKLAKVYNNMGNVHGMNARAYVAKGDGVKVNGTGHAERTAEYEKAIREYEEAISNYEKSIALDGNQEISRYNLGVKCFHIAYTIGKTIDTNISKWRNAEIYEKYGEAINHFARAIESCRKALEINPTYEAAKDVMLNATHLKRVWILHRANYNGDEYNARIAAKRAKRYLKELRRNLAEGQLGEKDRS